MAGIFKKVVEGSVIGSALGGSGGKGVLNRAKRQLNQNQKGADMAMRRKKQASAGTKTTKPQTALTGDKFG